VVAVIDVDSEQFGAFDEEDKAGLEAIAEILEQDVRLWS
jgi:putative methionine-R-sulfoxide reductase with GAF domain